MHHQQQHGGVCRDATPEEAETTVSKRICFAAQLDYDWTKPSMNFNYCVHPRWPWLRRGSLGDTKGGCGSMAQCGFWKTSRTLRLIYYTLTGGEFQNQNFNPRQQIIQFNLASDGLERCAEKRLSLRTYSKNSGQHGMPCISPLLLMFYISLIQISRGNFRWMKLTDGVIPLRNN